MYTNGEIIIEKKGLTVVLITEKTTISYLFFTEIEASDTFISLILTTENNI